jgi:hypothetical protein
MSSQPVVSIVMAAHNAARHVAETLGGVFAQTFDAWELIAIDDGSSDDTGHILDHHAAADARIRVVHQNNRGLAASLNTGIAESRGRYIARLDADDIPMPHRLATQVALLEQHPDIDVLGSSALYLADGVRTTALKSVPTDPHAIRRVLARGNCMIHPTVMMRKSAATGVGGYRACFRAAQDYDLWLRVVERGSLANTAEPLIYYRVHEGQTTVRRLHQQVWGVIAAQHAARQRRAGQADPLDGVAEITESTIKGLGLTSLEPDAMAAAFEDRVATHLLLSQQRQAFACAESIQASANDGQWRTLFKPRLDWQLAVDDLRRRRPLAGIGHAIMALRSQPRLLLRLPARLVACILSIGGSRP